MTSRAEQLLSRITALPPRGVPVPWLLDVDGVLNAGRAARFWGTSKTGAVPSDGWRYPMTWAPDLIRIINQLVRYQQVSVRWLTTWEHEAPKQVAPMMGLEVGDWVAGVDEGQATWWKLDVIKGHVVDEPGPFIWTDDEISSELPARQFVEFLPIDEALVVSPDFHDGLTPAHMDRLVSALEECW